MHAALRSDSFPRWYVQSAFNDQPIPSSYPYICARALIYSVFTLNSASIRRKYASCSRCNAESGPTSPLASA